MRINPRPRSKDTTISELIFRSASSHCVPINLQENRGVMKRKNVMHSVVGIEDFSLLLAHSS